MNVYYLVSDPFKVTDEKRLKYLLDNVVLDHYRVADGDVEIVKHDTVKRSSGVYHEISSQCEIIGVNDEKHDFFEELQKILPKNETAIFKIVSINHEIQHCYGTILFVTNNSVEYGDFNTIKESYCGYPQ